MKRYVVLTALMLGIPAIAFGQIPNGGNGGPPPGGGQGGGIGQGTHNFNNGGAGGPGGMQGGEGMGFQERKAEILKHINEHLAEIEQRKHCVEAAADHQALMVCMPSRPEGGMQGGNSSGPPNGNMQGPGGQNNH